MSNILTHTQNISSLSKSVKIISNVEVNLENFMKQIIYYDGFFQRVNDKLPDNFYNKIKKLILRCYEYRDLIREELQSNLAYIVDIGRMVIGIEDWNAKMKKRLNQLSEIVILTNSLLTEYLITQKKSVMSQELNDYLDSIIGIINLNKPYKY